MMKHPRFSKPVLIISAVSISMILAIFTLWSQPSKQFKIRDYGNSAVELRAALLKDLPIGSSLDDVYRFMKENNINKTINTNSMCGYRELKDKYVSLVACTGPLSGMWLIHFYFNETEHLVDITPVGYYP